MLIASAWRQLDFPSLFLASMLAMRSLYKVSDEVWSVPPTTPSQPYSTSLDTPQDSTGERRYRSSISRGSGCKYLPENREERREERRTGRRGGQGGEEDREEKRRREEDWEERREERRTGRRGGQGGEEGGEEDREERREERRTGRRGGQGGEKKKRGG
ncbi:unnamed protein product [Arctogadus glacialis]